MRSISVLVLGAALTWCASPASAQCPGDPGYTLTVTPPVVPIGTPFTVAMTAPVNSFALLILSSSPGPTVTPYGSLCVGFPFAGIFPVLFVQPRIDVPHLVECEPSIIGITGYFQFLALTPSDPVVHKSNSATISIADGSCNGSFNPGELVTFTQGAWGQKCNGNNLGCLRNANFAAVFPNGLDVGDPDGVDGDGIFAIHISNAAALENYLPDGSTPQALTRDFTDPSSTDSGVLGGQLTSAKCNVAFDDAGVFDPMKSNDGLLVGDLVYVDCVHVKLIGMTVRDVIALGERLISGSVASPVDVDGDLIPDVDYSDVSTALAKFNENFDNGTVNVGCLGTAFP